MAEVEQKKGRDPRDISSDPEGKLIVSAGQPLLASKGKGGRPVGSTTKIVKLQRIANRLEQMARTQGMTIIQESLDGKVVDKEKLATAKWTVTAAKEFHKACVQEKESRESSEEERPEIEESDDGNGRSTFSLVVSN